MEEFSTDVQRIARGECVSNSLIARATRIDARGSRVTVAGIPGGPGLSSQTLPFQTILDDINLVMIDPPGTAGCEAPCYVGTSQQAYDGVVESICEALRKETRVDDRLYVLGHSYGGILAVDIARRLSKRRAIHGVLLVASPFTRGLYASMSFQRELAGPEELRVAWRAYKAGPSQATYSALRLAYVSMVRGPNDHSAAYIESLFLHDQSCPFASHFVKREFDREYERLLRQGPATTVIAGSHDQLVGCEHSRKESLRLQLRFERIENAGHFPFVCQPEAFHAAISRAMHL